MKFLKRNKYKEIQSRICYLLYVTEVALQDDDTVREILQEHLEVIAKDLDLNWKKMQESVKTIINIQGGK